MASSSTGSLEDGGEYHQKRTAKAKLVVAAFQRSHAAAGQGSLTKSGEVCGIHDNVCMC